MVVKKTPLFSNLKNLNKKSKFLLYHFGATIIFGILYYLQDYFVSNYPDLAHRLKLGKAEPPNNTFDYWMWFSLLTQTTIGYSGPDSGSATNISYTRHPNVLFKILSFTQFASVFIITAQFV